MEIIREKTEKIFTQSVDIFKEQVFCCLKEKDVITVGIPGGKSAEQFFSFVLLDKSIPWDKIHIFMLDERVAPVDSIDSNYFLAYNTFLRQLITESRIPENNLHPVKFNFEHTSQFQVVKRYSDVLFGISNQLDILIVGVGPDGHIASLFPNHKSIENDSFGFIEVYDSPKMPKHRMSASKNLIKSSIITLAFFTGKEKHQSFKDFFNQDISEIQCPAKIIQKIKKLYLFTDLNE